MNDLINFNGILLEEKDGELYVDSLQIAEHFGKRHDHILRDIKNLETSEEFSRLNFGEIFYKDSYGRKQPKYIMTRDGFSILAMGFTGKPAMEWKEKYIQTFNKMEEILLNLKGTEWSLKRLEGKKVRKELTDTIKAFVEYASSQGSETYSTKPHLAYSQITRMQYSALFLLKKALPDLRDKIDLMDHNTLIMAERGVGKCLKECMKKGMYYKNIYQECKKRVLELADFVGVTDLELKLKQKQEQELLEGDITCD